MAADTFAAPVSPEAWGYVVSGYEVLRQWVKRRAGLDLNLDLQRQLLEVIWAVEQTVAMRPALNDFGERLLAASHFNRPELGVCGLAAGVCRGSRGKICFAAIGQAGENSSVISDQPVKHLEKI